MYISKQLWLLHRWKPDNIYQVPRCFLSHRGKVRSSVLVSLTSTLLLYIPIVTSSRMLITWTMKSALPSEERRRGEAVMDFPCVPPPRWCSKVNLASDSFSILCSPPTQTETLASSTSADEIIIAWRDDLALPKRVWIQFLCLLYYI